MTTQPDPTIRSTASTPKRLRDGAPSGRLCLVVIGEGLDATYPLPDSGRVAIGRAPDSDIRIDHPSVSRNHALLTIGDPLTLADLGSVNGTRVSDRWLHDKDTAEIGLGEPFDVGTVMVVVQQRSVPTTKRHIWAHGYFEARVDEEHARAVRSGETFAVIRIHCGSPEHGRIVENGLCRALRAMDVIGYYGPSEHEVLIVDTTEEDVRVVTEKLAQAFHSDGVTPSIGVALFPRDARSPYELMERASAAALGQKVSSATATPLVIANAAIQNLDRIVHRIAAGTISVLITGETGVGKEVLAERIHKLSRRADKPILRLNCAALSETLLESELFGHEKGAFTGATQTKAGLLETADGGTVFLDELGELPMSTQVKLLRVIEERQVMRVGALKPRFIDVRFVAATNRDLESEIARGTFRQDLYFRLNGITLVIPPLRERVSEIAALTDAFIAQAAERNGIARPRGITPRALALLSEYSWPGNIRELRNVIERAVLLGNGEIIDMEFLPMEKLHGSLGAQPRPPVSAEPRPARPEAPPPPAPEAALEAPLETITDQRARIIEALVRAGGNQTGAAKLLGISRRTLINHVEKLAIPRPRKK
jgi:transcriptional regulator with PAS, ATPase and Fis domain